jgi:hypothetical protein
MKISRSQIIFTAILVILTTTTKYFFGPNLDWSGFSPVIAIALFSGFIIKQKEISFILPLLALFLSDVIIQVLYSADLFPYAGFYSSQWSNYLILLTSVLIGWFLKGKNISSLAFGAFSGPTIFFLVSNLSTWMSSTQTLYPKTFSGLLVCYEAGIPFYRNSLIATLVFLPAILVLYNVIARKKAQLTLA